MTDKTPDPCGSDSSTELGRESIVWVRHNGKPHTSGIAHFGGECPPGWVGGARPFFSADYLAEAVRRLEKEIESMRDTLSWIYGSTTATPGFTDLQLGSVLAQIGQRAELALQPNTEVVRPEGCERTQS